MSFQITLQRNNSEKIRVDKNVVDITVIDGVLKDQTSLTDPVILFDGDLATMKSVNYMTIPIFGRSYFVSNPTVVRTGLIQFSAHVDVISSFAQSIRANRAIVHKQESKWNLYLNDGSFKVYQNPMVLTRLFPAGFTTQEFVLAVAGS